MSVSSRSSSRSSKRNRYSAVAKSVFGDAWQALQDAVSGIGDMRAKRPLNANPDVIEKSGIGPEEDPDLVKQGAGAIRKPTPMPEPTEWK
jgi:hypothetical protein